MTMRFESLLVLGDVLASNGADRWAVNSVFSDTDLSMSLACSTWIGFSWSKDFASGNESEAFNENPLLATASAELFGISLLGSTVPTGACQLSQALWEISRPAGEKGSVPGFLGAKEESARVIVTTMNVPRRKTVIAKALFFIFPRINL